jgi:class 3 adenylate cyclase
VPARPSCGAELVASSKFCSECGARLAPASTSRREERKVVSVVFVDLVGSTARAESSDPEDVRALRRGYHERSRDELERRGGTVEKFIGDAVVAVFGAPVAHEDDPERAVRAALAVRDAVAGLNEDDAAEIMASTGEEPLQAELRLRAATAFVSEGKLAEAEAQLDRARAFWRSVGATTYLRQANELIAEAS